MMKPLQDSVAAEKRLQDERISNDAIEQIIADPTLKGLRLGDCRLVVNECVSRILGGRHERIVGGKSFSFRVDQDARNFGVVNVFRLS